jgi:hypothetical protein
MGDAKHHPSLLPILQIIENRRICIFKMRVYLCMHNSKEFASFAKELMYLGLILSSPPSLKFEKIIDFCPSKVLYLSYFGHNYCSMYVSTYSKKTTQFGEEFIFIVVILSQFLQLNITNRQNLGHKMTKHLHIFHSY